MLLINGLINQELLNQALGRFGLQTTPIELVESIKKNDQFYRDGKFDIDYYNERFLPGYQLATGTSFEKEMMDEINTKKFFGTFENLLELSPDEAQRLYQIDNTKFKFAVIKVKKENQEVANKIWDSWKKNGNIESMLTENKLTKTETRELGYTNLKSMFGGKVSTDNVKKILSLSSKNPFPETYLDEGNDYYLIKLVEMTAVPQKMDEASLTKIKEDFSKSLDEDLKSSFIAELRKNAKIKVYQ
jgi:hypothetical protein